MKDLNNIFKSLNDLKDKRDSKKTNLKSEKVDLSAVDRLTDEFDVSDDLYRDAFTFLDKVRNDSFIAKTKFEESFSLLNNLKMKALDISDTILDLTGELPSGINQLMDRINDRELELMDLIDDINKVTSQF